MEDLAAEDAFDDFLVDDDLLAEALPDESIETDEERQTRPKSIVDNCLNCVVRIEGRSIEWRC